METDDLTAIVHDRQVHIRQDVDQRFRRMLTEAVASRGGNRARRLIARALQDNPSRGGVAESVRFFGDGLQEKLAVTAQIVDGLEITTPGFKRWLELTGFGNDVTMIRGFVAWAEHTSGRGHVIGSAKQRLRVLT